MNPTLAPPPTREVFPTHCGVCPAGCGVDAHVVDGVIERMSPIRSEHPSNAVCPRGMMAQEVVYSPDRILYPQQRSGPRGSGEFQRIGWDQAYDDMVGNLGKVAAKYGPEAVGMYTGRGNFEFALNEMFAPAGTVTSSANAVLFPFGSPNTTGVGSLCYVSYGMIAPRACFGEYSMNMKDDLDQADLILIWGANPITDSSPINIRHLKQAQRRGARIIVIDHRRSETARATGADWIGVRPGTDGALALAAIHVLLDEGLYDAEFAANWTHGFKELRDYVRAFTPERAAEITWTSPDQIRDLARAVACARGCSILTYTGLEYSNSGVQAIRALWTLQALAGHLDVPGGKLFKMRERTRTARLLTEPPADAPKPIGAEEYPIYHEVRNEGHGALWPRAILEGKPYPLRALIVAGSSLITSWPNPKQWRRALAALDYLVIVNRFPTADAAFADIILPAATYFEIESYMLYDDRVQLRQKTVEPRGEARNDYLIFAELAERLGYGHRWPQSEEAMIRYALEGTGVTLEALRANPKGVPIHNPPMQYRKYETGGLREDGKPGFNTPTGKFEITSEWLRQHGFNALPVYTEPSEGPLARPDLTEPLRSTQDEAYPLVFNSGARSQWAFRSQHHNIPSLVKKHPHPLVHMHTDDAAARGIADGDEVAVVSPRGEVRFHALVNDDIVPGVVEANMGGGGPIGPQAWQLSNVNDLTDFENRDPISGFPVFKALLCDVKRVQR